MTSRASRPAAAASILIVDDAAANLELLSELLGGRGYEPRPALSGEHALMAAQADPPDLVLLDVDMPGMDGYEVCRRLKADTRLKDIPVIFVSAIFTQAEDKVKALSLGAVDYVTKPFQAEEVYARVETHLRLRSLQVEVERHSRDLEDLVQQKVEEIVSAQMATIFALAKLAEYRDDDTGRHLERVGTYCRILAEEMRRAPKYAAVCTDQHIDNLERAAPLHDIGKVAIPDAILLKPGKLTAEEFEQMKRHTTLGADTLRAVLAEYPSNAFLVMGIEIAQSHHEKWDGGGYPQGLAGEAIPLAARIMAVADVYDAVRSKRSYKPAMPHAAAREVIVDGRGSQFDPVVVDAFAARADELAAVRIALESE
ncbi:MAG: HD domain-containing phosphohydrolase [Actinomycetes bacterium]